MTPGEHLVGQVSIASFLGQPSIGDQSTSVGCSQNRIMGFFSPELCEGNSAVGGVQMVDWSHGFYFLRRPCDQDLNRFCCWTGNRFGPCFFLWPVSVARCLVLTVVVPSKDLTANNASISWDIYGDGFATAKLFYTIKPSQPS